MSNILFYFVLIITMSYQFFNGVYNDNMLEYWIIMEVIIAVMFMTAIHDSEYDEYSSVTTDEGKEVKLPPKSDDLMIFINRTSINKGTAAHLYEIILRQGSVATNFLVRRRIS